MRYRFRKLRKNSSWLTSVFCNDNGLDYDTFYKQAKEYVEDIKKIDDTTNPIIHKTKNGLAILVDHGFDTRELLEKWPNPEIKRDDLLLIRWDQKNVQLFDDGELYML